jgi:hypothetical protein
MAKPTLQTHVAKAVGAAPVQEIMDGLKDLVLLRLRNRQRTTQRTPSVTASPFASAYSGGPGTTAPAAFGSKPRRSARRLGRIKFYEATSKLDVSRSGTFRRYMISTIRAHSNTRDANRAHDACTEPKFAKNKLDFNWAADNGYIRWL